MPPSFKIIISCLSEEKILLTVVQCYNLMSSMKFLRVLFAGGITLQSATVDGCTLNVVGVGENLGHKMSIVHYSSQWQCCSCILTHHGGVISIQWGIINALGIKHL